MTKSLILTAFIIIEILASPALATPKSLLESYRAEAKAQFVGFKDFSRERGRELYMQKSTSGNSETACATCHSSDARNFGRTRANKAIDPMAPSANPKRFTDPIKVEKWFSRNCDDVFHRPCTSIEKGDFITYLLTLE